LGGPDIFQKLAACGDKFKAKKSDNQIPNKRKPENEGKKRESLKERGKNAPGVPTRCREKRGPMGAKSPIEKKISKKPREKKKIPDGTFGQNQPSVSKGGGGRGLQV